MAKRLFVGGLPWSVTDQELSDIFAKFGTVASAKVIVDKFSGRSKGFGFVEFADDEDGKKAGAAIAELNETEMQGRKIVVNEARPMEERRPDSGGGRRFDNNGPRRDSGRSGGYQRGGKSW